MEFTTLNKKEHNIKYILTPDLYKKINDICIIKDANIIDVYIKRINKNNDNIILDYDYEIIDNHNIKIKIIFKHLFKKLDELQKYVNFNIKIKENKIIITNKDTNYFSEYTNIELLPINNISIEYKEACNNVFIKYFTDQDLDTYKNSYLLTDFIKEMFTSIVNNFNS